MYCCEVCELFKKYKTCTVLKKEEHEIREAIEDVIFHIVFEKRFLNGNIAEVFNEIDEQIEQICKEKVKKDKKDKKNIKAKKTKKELLPKVNEEC